METLNFEIDIKSSPEEIWKILWDEETYKVWTQFFSKDSVMKTDWKIGGKTYFLDQKGNGMVSTISTLKKPFEIVFRHLGWVENNVETTKTKEVEEWSGMEEKYFLSERECFTHLKVIVHSPNEYHDMMKTSFTRGLEMVKMLSERK
ncbi:SRPBCC domain-containing protein [Halpernia sp.]|uniref:SRPBCC domain-containing protein n=1 Tax=Halpernia sp. TaxID=2782209 RepID=UPI003A92E651